jgi:hypothetical protein
MHRFSALTILSAWASGFFASNTYRNEIYESIANIEWYDTPVIVPQMIVVRGFLIADYR